MRIYQSTTTEDGQGHAPTVETDTIATEGRGQVVGEIVVGAEDANPVIKVSQETAEGHPVEVSHEANPMLQHTLTSG